MALVLSSPLFTLLKSIHIYPPSPSFTSPAIIKGPAYTGIVILFNGEGHFY